MPDAVHERLNRLEEAALFADRRLDELHEEVLTLAGRLDALAARLARFEQASTPPPDPADPFGPGVDAPSLE